MKKILLAILIVLSTAVFAGVFHEQRISKTGQPLIRFHNQTDYYLSCHYRDQYNFITFTLGPKKTTRWYPVYGQFQWQCKK